MGWDRPPRPEYDPRSAQRLKDTALKPAHTRDHDGRKAPQVSCTGFSAPPSRTRDEIAAV